MAQVSVKSLQKSFGSVEVLKDINLEVENGSFVVLVGPSGCGKSTLLRCIAGLDRVNAGEITIGGKRVTDLAPAQREIAMVFQSYALYPHMDVEKNMGFGLRFSGASRQEIAARVGEAARILKLEELLKRRPRELSGGQRQRVAIGRAIVRKPQVFLFDEPLSNLDAALRVNTRVEFAKLHKLLNATIVYVTHDQVEAMTLADKIVVINQGRIEQAGKPLDLYYRPANRFVANFIGSPSMNMVAIEVTGPGRARTAAGNEFALNMPATVKVNDKLTLGARPEHLTLGAPGEGLVGQLDLVERLGEIGYAHVDLAGGERFIVEVRGEPGAHRGDKVSVRLDPKHLHFFGQDGAAI